MDLEQGELMNITIPETYSQKRHRTNGTRRYDPSAKDKKTIRQYLLQVKPSKPLDGEFEIIIKAYFETPKSWSNKKRNRIEGMFRPKSPDVDNIEKIIFDSMNDYILKDDRMIVKSSVEKRYSVNPRMEIELRQL